MVINVIVRGLESVWGDVKGVFDDFYCLIKFGNNFFVGKSGKCGVRLGVDRDFVVGYVFSLEYFGLRKDMRVDNEESGFDVFFFKVVN